MERDIKNFTDNKFILNTAILKENGKLVGNGIVIQINNDTENDITTISFTEEQARKLLCALLETLSYLETKK